MTKPELRLQQRRLTALATRLRGDVADLRDEALDASITGGSNDQLADAGEIASHEAGRDVTLSLLASDENILADVKGALGRIEDGTYGECLECGKVITQTRLRALPYARFCRSCAKRHEAEMVP